ncbi:tRNA lysidine(34) synthetase TilS [Ramlibacter sp. AN1015]|uniref:tRNA lysidine(34) synthetase TilS n=1 Tax=Ramlibacter sp. AN1015 TaxID=3133428 RepID=UPI0030BDE0CD
MAASATPRPTPAEGPLGRDTSPPAANESARDTIVRALAALQPALPLGVAYSGGADSTALLRAAHARWGGQVHALHVHHGLQAAADAFEAHCRRSCAELAVPLHVLHVNARHRSGDSPEDAARRARYAALAALARTNGLATVLVAQHADDQIETLLLALSRGAGVPGLASMPARFEREGVQFERPLLQLPGALLRTYLAEAGIEWVEDPSNADVGLTRNRIRRLLVPALEAAFPQMRETFARSARHAAEAKELLQALGAQDLAAMGGAPDIAALQALPRARQSNLLRHWLRSSHAVAPSAAQLDELLDQVASCRTRSHGLRLRVAAGFVQREGGRLTYTPTL